MNSQRIDFCARIDLSRKLPQALERTISLLTWVRACDISCMWVGSGDGFYWKFLEAAALKGQEL